MKFQIMIKETLSKVVEIEADSKEKAEELAKINYDSADDNYILSADDWDKTELYCVQ